MDDETRALFSGRSEWTGLENESTVSDMGIFQRDPLETETGIGGQDRDMFSGYADGAPWAEVGEAYAVARAGANEIRARAFYALPDFGTPQGSRLDFHPLDPTFPSERERGIPAW